MAIVEVLIHIRDEVANPITDPAKQWGDGMVVEFRRPGLFISTSDIQNYLNNGVVPPGVNNLDPAFRRRIKRVLQFRRFFRHKTPQQVDEQFNIGLDWAQAEVEATVRLEDAIVASGGFDTTWSYGELRTHVVARADFTLEQIQEMLEPEWNDDVAVDVPFMHDAVTRLRNRRIPYWNLAPPPRVNRWRDPNDIVHVVRTGQPLSYSDTEEIP